ncbi:MAG: NAD(P)/FAD-dependent oxidoreductase [Sterolibacteriaceae bacterium MAG5]|nr:NAD(P)/FAD-dependent oxidoreductase [Candidatus Nitricoxidireducens bremensis]
MDTNAPRPIGILGGGPAGLSAALWLKNLGFSPWVADPADRSGGMQNLNFLANDWVLGQVGYTGPELAARHADHVRGLGIPLLQGFGPRRIARDDGGFSVVLANGSGETRAERCIALLVATGTRYRGAELLVGVAGIGTLPADRIVYGPYAFSAMEACCGQRLLIVGGGDNAFENARLLLGEARSIDMALRSPPRAQQVLRDAVAGKVRLHPSAVLAAVEADGGAIRATLRTAAGPVVLTVDRIHVLAGYEPNTAFLREIFVPAAAFEFDADGYLKTDAAGRTAVPGIYAAGDVCNPAFPNVVAALAQGARAAKTIELDLRRP